MSRNMPVFHCHVWFPDHPESHVKSRQWTFASFIRDVSCAQDFFLFLVSAGGLRHNADLTTIGSHVMWLSKVRQEKQDQPFGRWGKNAILHIHLPRLFVLALAGLGDAQATAMDADASKLALKHDIPLIELRRHLPAAPQAAQLMQKPDAIVMELTSPCGIDNSGKRFYSIPELFPVGRPIVPWQQNAAHRTLAEALCYLYLRNGLCYRIG